jgi:hypothetical protein
VTGGQIMDGVRCICPCRHQPRKPLSPGARAIVRLLAEQIAGDILAAEGIQPPRAPVPARKPLTYRRAPRGRSTEALLTIGQILARAVPKDRQVRSMSAGVYFLLDVDRVVYVGSTHCLAERLAAHRARPHTHVAWVECRFYLDLEQRYIAAYRPPWNGL